MATQVLRFVPAFLLLFFLGTAFSQSFPHLADVSVAFYQTEVQITSVQQEFSAYATEYFNSIDQQGALELYYQGDKQLLYYDNSTYQITTVSDTSCNSTDIDISEYDYNSIYYGWLNKDPIVIGPSAPLWYAQIRKEDVVGPTQQEVRSIMCDKYTLAVKNKYDDLIYEYYYATADWTTPYKYADFRVPVRIRIVGNSSRYAAKDRVVPVDQISDFAYFKTTIDDFTDLLPPIGIGCKQKKKTDYMPDVPKVFEYSAEVVNLLTAENQTKLEIQFEKTWYDQPRLLARRYGFSRKKGFRSDFYDFNTGTRYKIVDDGTCEMAILRDTDFQTYDYGMTSRIKTPKEVLNLDGDFYEMGKRTIRGLRCDTFESVQENKHYKNKLYSRLVVTVYFTESGTKVGVDGEMESRIPIYYIITGWETPTSKTLQLQYNIFGFKDVIFPEMYSSFRLDRCFTKVDSKSYFVLVIPAAPELAAKMEEVDKEFISILRSQIAKHARIRELRIPYLKADYKTTGVYVTGVMLERPLSSIQFYELDTGPTVTRDKFIKIIPEAENIEECSHACVDEGKFLCKGFYFCGQDCFLTSVDPFDIEDNAKTRDLGVCTEYYRGEIESTNFRQSYLVDALGYLDQAVVDGNFTFPFKTANNDEGVVTVQDVIIGDGPYIGDDAGDKPFAVSVEFRKLDSSLGTSRTDFAGTLHDCYKRCKEAGSQCSSFSFCPDSKSADKECIISSELVIKDVTKDTDLVTDKECNIYHLKFTDYFIPYPEKEIVLGGDKVIEQVSILDKCAASCRLEKDFTCRGFQYCSKQKTCTLHKKHIVSLKPGEVGTSAGGECVHYAARFIVDYADLGGVLVDDKSNVRYDTTIEECAQICSEDLKTDCKSFNFCQKDDMSGTSCELSTKLLRDGGTTTTEKKGCKHYEKRDSVNDWDKKKTSKLTSGYTTKGFTGLVIGMIALGIIVGALGFIFYSYMRSRSSGEGVAVRFMKNDA